MTTDCHSHPVAWMEYHCTGTSRYVIRLAVCWTHKVRLEQQGWSRAGGANGMRDVFGPPPPQCQYEEATKWAHS